MGVGQTLQIGFDRLPRQQSARGTRDVLEAFSSERGTEHERQRARTAARAVRVLAACQGTAAPCNNSINIAEVFLPTLYI